jgi:hypothetical protein
MELNMTLQILAFCVPPFKNSWHFAFYIFLTKHTLTVGQSLCSATALGYQMQPSTHQQEEAFFFLSFKMPAACIGTFVPFFIFFFTSSDGSTVRSS